MIGAWGETHEVDARLELLVEAVELHAWPPVEWRWRPVVWVWAAVVAAAAAAAAPRHATRGAGEGIACQISLDRRGGTATSRREGHG